MARHIVSELTRALRAEHGEERGILKDIAAALAALEGGVPPAADVLAPLAEQVAKVEAEIEAHFRREEVALFPLLRPHLGTAASPIPALVAQHEAVRRLFRAFREAWGRLEGAGPAERGEAAGAVRQVLEALRSLLAEHVREEEDVLFDLAEIYLSPAEKQLALERMAALGRPVVGLGV